MLSGFESNLRLPIIKTSLKRVARLIVAALLPPLSAAPSVPAKPFGTVDGRGVKDVMS